MADSISISNLTSSGVTINYSFDNSGRAYTIYGHIFLAPGSLSFSTIEANPGSYLKQTRGVGPGATLTDSLAQSISANTTYSYMYSVTTSSTFNSADVIYRRPLSPPGTFTSYGPPIYTDSTVKSTGTVGVYYSDGVSATSATSYSIHSGSLPLGVSLSSNTGAISGTPTSAGSYTFRISANNSYGSTITSSLTITVAPPAPVWIDQTINPTAYVGSLYSDGVSASNDAKYRISSGALPSGITLGTATGNISGTATTAGTSNFTVQAYNTSGTISVGLTLEAITGLQAPVWTDDTLSTALRVGSAYADGVSATDAASYAVAGTIVPGLTLNTTNGSVTGTPTAQGSYPFTLQAINAAGTASANFTLVVAPSVRKYDGAAFDWVDTLKRWDGSNWVDVTFVRRWDGSSWTDANG